MEGVVDAFRKGKLKLLTLTETKLKRNRSCHGGVNGTTASVQEIERAKEGKANMLNDVCHSAVIDFGCISSRILWVKFKVSRVKVCVK